MSHERSVRGGVGVGTGVAAGAGAAAGRGAAARPDAAAAACCTGSARRGTTRTATDVTVSSSSAPRE